MNIAERFRICLSGGMMDKNPSPKVAKTLLQYSVFDLLRDGMGGEVQRANLVYERGVKIDVMTETQGKALG